MLLLALTDSTIAGGRGATMEQPERDSYAQFRDQTRFWIQRVAVPLLMVIGLFGNSITVIIMTRRRMRSTTNMYLAALAFVDMLYLVLTFLLGLSHYPNMAGIEYLVYWKSRPFLMMLTDACSNTSVWLTVTFTIERFIAVKYPMKGKVWCTEARAKMLIVCVFMFGVLFATPVPFEWRVVEKRIPKESFTINVAQESSMEPPPSGTLDSIHQIASQSESSSGLLMSPGRLNAHENIMNKNSTFTYKTVLALDYSDFGSNETFKTIYYGSTAVLFYFIPLFSLMLFNGFLIKSVHQSQRERTKMVRPSVSSTQCSQTKLDAGEVSSTAGSNQASWMDGATRGVPNESKGFLLSHSSFKRGRRGNKSSLKEQRNCMKLEPNTNTTNSSQLKNCLLSLEVVRDGGAITNLGRLKNVLPDDSIESPSSALENEEHGLQISCDNKLEMSANEGRELIGANDKSTTLQSATTGHWDKQTMGNLQEKALLQDNQQLPPLRPVKQTLSLKRSLLTNSSTRSVVHPASLAPVSSQERRITIMLIAVVILFLVCQIPSAAMLLYTSVRELEPNSKEEAIVLAFGNIFNFLMAVNAAGDFILYSFLSKKYRKTFMILFCSCIGSHNNNAKQSHYDTRRSIRFESSSQQLVKKCSATHQNSRSSDKSLKDTPL